MLLKGVERRLKEDGEKEMEKSQEVSILEKGVGWIEILYAKCK